MKKHTFTIFCENDSIYGYVFNVTRIEVQDIVNKMNKEKKGHYFMEGYLE